MIINIEYLNDNNQLLGTYKVKLNTVSENTNADKWINAQVSRNNLLKGTFFDFNNKSWEIKNLWNKGYIIKLICDPMKCNKFRILMTFDNNKKFIFNWNNIFNFNNNLNKFESVIKHYSTDGYFLGYKQVALFKNLPLEYEGLGASKVKLFFNSANIVINNQNNNNFIIQEKEKILLVKYLIF